MTSANTGMSGKKNKSDKYPVLTEEVPASEYERGTPADLKALGLEPSRMKLLKGALRNAFTVAGAKGIAVHAFNGVCDKIKNRKAEMLFTTGASAIIKLAAIGGCSATFVTTVPGIMLIGAATGATSTIIRHNFALYHAEKGAARDALRLSNKDMALKILTGAAASSLFAGLGSGVVHSFNWFKDICGGGPDGSTSFIVQHQANPVPNIKDSATIAQTPSTSSISTAPAATPAPDAVVSAAATPSVTEAHTAPPPSAEAEAVAPATTPDASVLATPAPRVMTSPLDAIKEYAAQNNVSPKLKDALLRVESTSPRIRAQALDDIAVYAPKSMQIQAYDLLKQSASLGNLKAKADMITMEFYGNKVLGIKADPEAAADKMVELSKKSKYAAKMVEEWLGKPFVPATAPSIAPDVIPAIPPVPEPSVPTPSVLEHFNTPAEAVPTQVTPVEIDPAPAVEKSYIAPDCIVSVDVTSSRNMMMICTDNGAELPEPGETVSVHRPALLRVVAPR